MQKSKLDKDIYNNITEYLYGVKCMYGSKQIPATLIRHPKIRDFLKKYLAEYALDIEADITEFLDFNNS